MPFTEGTLAVSIGEAAVRPCVSRDELEAMIEAGKIQALPTGLTVMVPVAEVEWLAPRKMRDHRRRM